MTETLAAAAVEATWSWRGALLADLAKQGLEAQSRVKVVQDLTLPPNVAAILKTQDVVTLASEMFADGIPVQAAMSWLPVSTLGHEPADFTEAVTVRRPTGEEISTLGIDPDQRVFVIRRTAEDAAGNVIEISNLSMPAHAFRLAYSYCAPYLEDSA